MRDLSEFDEHGQWIGPCEECGTNHDGYEPESLGGTVRCLRARAEQLGDQRLIAKVDELRRTLDEKRGEMLRRAVLICDL